MVTKLCLAQEDEDAFLNMQQAYLDARKDLQTTEARARQYVTTPLAFTCTCWVFSIIRQERRCQIGSIFWQTLTAAIVQPYCGCAEALAVRVCTARTRWL